MGDRVFVNGRGVVCQSSDGKAIAAFPDVCLSPPPPPAGPVPVPYPNTAMASDLSEGSKTVSIDGKPVCLRDTSYFKTSSGDEGGTQGGGVASHKTKGKAYFSSWSMDVKYEGKNVCRHLDTSMHNASSYPRNTGPWPYLSEAQLKPGGPCDGVDVKFQLTPYDKGCPDGKTPHHLIPDRTMHLGDKKLFTEYSHGSAPCICVTGSNQHTGEHSKCHAIFDAVELTAHEEIQAGNRKSFTYGDAKTAAADSSGGLTSGAPSSSIKECLKAQLDNYYKDRCGATDSTPLRTSGKPGKHIEKSDPLAPVDV